jgi:hypothetical protein
MLVVAIEGTVAYADAIVTQMIGQSIEIAVRSNVYTNTVASAKTD